MDVTLNPRPRNRRLLFLGTGTSVGVPTIGCDCAVCTSTDPKNKRTRPSVLISSPGGNLLIDTAPDLRTQLLREEIGRIEAVLYTHYHADHVFGFDDLRVFARYLERDLPVYCDPEVETFLRSTFGYAFDPIVRNYPAGGVPRVEFRRIDRPNVEILDHQVVPIPLEHGRYRVLGYRFDSLAYCTDVNRIPEESWPLLEGLEILVLDALRHKPHPTHFSLGEALEVIERVKPQRAYLTHISCQLDPEQARREMPPHVELAHDGLTINF
jgi:phosphoribosyl 1,2-cyclic phosphate phosphodiesterase